MQTSALSAAGLGWLQGCTCGPLSPPPSAAPAAPPAPRPARRAAAPPPAAPPQPSPAGRGGAGQRGFSTPGPVGRAVEGPRCTAAGWQDVPLPPRRPHCRPAPVAARPPRRAAKPTEQAAGQPPRGLTRATLGSRPFCRRLVTPRRPPPPSTATCSAAELQASSSAVGSTTLCPPICRAQERAQGGAGQREVEDAGHRLPRAS